MSAIPNIIAATHADHAAAFLAAVKGIPANFVTRALREFTTGIDWVRCSKARMAEAYADAKAGRGGMHTFAPFKTLDALRSEALRLQTQAAGHRHLKATWAAKAREQYRDAQRKKQQHLDDMALVRARLDHHRERHGEPDGSGVTIQFTLSQWAALYRITAP